MPPGLFRKEDSYIRKRWRQVQYITDLFWKRLVKEYLTMMQERQKWHKPRRNFKVGDLVLLVEDTSPRNSWLMGRITETMADSKGYDHGVRLKTKTSVSERPAFAKSPCYGVCPGSTFILIRPCTHMHTKDIATLPRGSSEETFFT